MNTNHAVTPSSVDTPVDTPVDTAVDTAVTTEADTEVSKPETKPDIRTRIINPILIDIEGERNKKYTVETRSIIAKATRYVREDGSVTIVVPIALELRNSERAYKKASGLSGRQWRKYRKATHATHATHATKSLSSDESGSGAQG